jgi:hypothetical protein
MSGSDRERAGAFEAFIATVLQFALTATPTQSERPGTFEVLMALSVTLTRTMVTEPTTTSTRLSSLITTCWV